MQARAAAIPNKLKGFIYTTIAQDSMTWSNSIEVPKIGSHDVLVRVASSSLNPFDFRVPEMGSTMIAYSGKPVGCDVAGEVVSTGKKVENLKVGDNVFGWGHGLADYCVTSADKLARIPHTLDPSHMGIYPCVSVTALQVLRKYWLTSVGFQPESILIIGCSGGVGSALIQMAREFGGSSMNIYGVCSKQHEPLCKQYGAKQIFDYHEDGFEISKILPPGSVDLVIDTCSGTPECPNYAATGHTLVRDNGKYVTLNPLSRTEYIGTRILQAVKKSSPLKHKKHEFFVVERNNSSGDLAKVAQLVETGKLNLAVVETVPMEEHALHKAFEKLEARHVGGKYRVVPEL